MLYVNLTNRDGDPVAVIGYTNLSEFTTKLTNALMDEYSDIDKILGIHMLKTSVDALLLPNEFKSVDLLVVFGDLDSLRTFEFSLSRTWVY